MVELNPKWDWVETNSENFTKALNAIFNTEDNLFIMGAGGVGKSILLKIVYDHFPKCLVLSSTGISAANLSVDGIPASTVHSVFKLPPIELFNSFTPTQEIIELITKTKLILVDEVSMISASLMDFILKTSRKSSKFVKPRIILFGDIFQLPPIKTRNKTVRDFYRKNYDDNYFFFSSNYYSKMKFKTIHLTEVYRQKDKEFIDILNRIRVGLHTKNDLKLINSRVVTDIKKFIDDNPLTLYLATTNNQVNKLNEEYSNRPEFKNFRNYYAEFSDSSGPTDFPNVLDHIKIAVGQQVMCLANNWEAGYQNGTMGIVENIYPEMVAIRLSDGSRVYVKYHKWSKYEYKYNKDTDEIEYKEVSSVSQIGCKPAFAVTFHKSQGLTLESIVVDLSSSFIPESGIYLALSRCVSLDGIALTHEITDYDIKVNYEALNFLAENYDDDVVEFIEE